MGRSRALFLFPEALSVFFAWLITAGAGFAPALVTASATAFSLGAGVKRGYTDGFIEAWSGLINDTCRWNALLAHGASEFAKR